MCNDDRGVVAMINRYRIRPMTISGTRLTRLCMAVCDGDWIKFHEVEDLHAPMRGLIMALRATVADRA